MADYDVIIIGAGVAGLTAASFAARRGMRTLVLDRIGVGGQIVNAPSIVDFPGLPAISGTELGPLLHEQAEAAGAEFQLDEVEALIPGSPDHIVRTAGGSFTAPAIIVAAGSRLRDLGVPGEARLLGRGVSHCASCDAPFFRGKAVVVVGGGDSAVDEALVAAEHAAPVTILCRGAALEAQKSLLDRLAGEPKVSVALNTEVVEVLGEDGVTGIRLRDTATGALSEQAAEGVFVYVGLEPNTEFLAGALKLDAAGHIETDIRLETSIPGIFAAGDIRANSAAQLASAAGDGATAAVGAWHRAKEQR